MSVRRILAALLVIAGVGAVSSTAPAGAHPATTARAVHTHTAPATSGQVSPDDWQWD